MKRILTEKDIHRGPLILVNATYPLQEDIVYDNLEAYNASYPSIFLNKNMNQSLVCMINELQAQKQIVPVSGYRTLAEQKKIYEDSIIENGIEFTKKYVAFPNTSEHQTGLAIDLGLNEKNIDFIRPSFPRRGISEKFRQLASSFGFIERYMEDKENITKISAEEWHFRFVGYPHAKWIKEHNLCLEEYIERIKRQPIIYQNYEISYIPYSGIKIVIELDADDTVSGNNVDGFIVTRKINDDNK